MNYRQQLDIEEGEYIMNIKEVNIYFPNDNVFKTPPVTAKTGSCIHEQYISTYPLPMLNIRSITPDNAKRISIRVS